MQEIKEVAVIGAGISGICAAAHLMKQGLSVVLYERSSIAGGVWHFDPRSAHEPPYPNEKPSKGDYQLYENIDAIAYDTPPATPSNSNSSSPHRNNVKYSTIDHAPPGPCYAGLRNNVSLTNMRTSLQDWPPGLEEFVSQKHLEEYVQTISLEHGVNGVTRYDTRVEDVRKIGQRWRLKTTTFRHDRMSRTTEMFDAVVVASGHYNMPRVPDLPGLQSWKSRFPDRVSHSKRYRDATRYIGRTVLLIGAGVSSVDIAKEIVAAGGNVIQSARGGAFDLPASMLPHKSARRVGGLTRFVLTDSQAEENGPVPGKVVLANGDELDNIHDVIVATGYITSYPFLADKHSDFKPAHEADRHLLVTKEGDMVHNLHKDIFYIPDPTLSFVGVPYHVSTFSLFDFQAQVVARVYAGNLEIPSQALMQSEYDARVSARGLGRDFHSLRGDGAEIGYVEALVTWANSGKKEAVMPMSGHTSEWHAAHQLQREMLHQRGVLK